MLLWFLRPLLRTRWIVSSPQANPVPTTKSPETGSKKDSKKDSKKYPAKSVSTSHFSTTTTTTATTNVNVRVLPKNAATKDRSKFPIKKQSRNPKIRVKSYIKAVPILEMRTSEGYTVKLKIPKSYSKRIFTSIPTTEPATNEPVATKPIKPETMQQVPSVKSVTTRTKKNIPKKDIEESSLCRLKSDTEFSVTVTSVEDHD